MRAAGYLLYGASVVLAAAIPYLHVSEQVYGPRQDRLEARLQASMTELRQRQAELRERSRELTGQLDETSEGASELRQRTGELGETLLRERSDLESRLARVESLREQQQSLEQRLERAASTVDAQQRRIDEAERRQGRLQQEIQTLREQLESAAAQGLVGECGRVRPRPGHRLAPESAPDGRGRKENPRGLSLPSSPAARAVPPAPSSASR